MKKKIKILDLFSGIGGFSKGFIDAGYEIEKHYFSEIDKHAIAVYKHNFKDAIYAGSVEHIQSGDIERPDVITFGSPCQDFSLAGKRKGMGGERSSLILEAIRLISELRPSVFIWENVKGAFSSNNSADFWAILQAFANIGGYRLEWQLLNTVWFLPQNRERIYLVGHLAGRSEPGIFPIFENDFFSTKEKGSIQPRLQTYNCSTINNKMGQHGSDTFVSLPKIAGCLTAGGNSGGLHSDMTTIKVGAIRGRNPENPTSRKSGQHTEQMLEINNNGCSNTLTSVQKDNVVVGTWRTHKDGQGFREVKGGNSPTIPARAREDGSGQPVITDNDTIRRLTEIECERLQGFPDNWTEYGIYERQVWINKKELIFKVVEEVEKVPKTQRYKQCGNAVTVAVVKAVAERIKIYEDHA